MRLALFTIVLATLVGCSKDDERIEFAPGQLLLASASVETGEPVSYTVSGKFGVAEIFQGTTRVSLLSVPDVLTTFEAVSTELPHAIAWGNDRRERQELNAIFSETLNPCGVLGVYEGELAWVTNGNSIGVACSYPPVAPIQARFEASSPESGLLDSERLGQLPRSALPSPVTDTLCTFVWGNDYSAAHGSWVTIKVQTDHIDVWIDKNAADTSQNPGCYRRYHASFPLP